MTGEQSQCESRRRQSNENAIKFVMIMHYA